MLCVCMLVHEKAVQRKSRSKQIQECGMLLCVNWREHTPGALHPPAASSAQHMVRRCQHPLHSIWSGGAVPSAQHMVRRCQQAAGQERVGQKVKSVRRSSQSGGAREQSGNAHEKQQAFGRWAPHQAHARTYAIQQRVALLAGHPGIQAGPATHSHRLRRIACSVRVEELCWLLGRGADAGGLRAHYSCAAGMLE